MRARTLAALAAVGLIGFGLTASPASARPDGPYVGILAGAALDGDAEMGAQTGDLDNGWAGGLTAGHAFANGLRPEVEVMYRDNSVGSVAGASATGDATVWSVMLNGYYDFLNDTAWTPYLGLGLGYANVDYGSVSPVGASSVNDSDGAFAYQGIAGIGYDVTETTTAFLDYRYFRAADVGTNNAAGASAGGDYDNHTVMVGLRFSFGAPKPAPAPEPVAQPVAQPAPEPEPEPAPVEPMAAEPEPAPMVRNYIVFFDWDSSQLTVEALKILEQAVANAKAGGVSRIELTGHADRSGPSWYNDGLSQRRAKAVQAELATQGIDLGGIALDWKGESEPLVPTDDGVREPQNRRVEITFPE